MDNSSSSWQTRNVNDSELRPAGDVTDTERNNMRPERKEGETRTHVDVVADIGREAALLEAIAGHLDQRTVANIGIVADLDLIHVAYLEGPTSGRDKADRMRRTYCGR